MKKKLEMNFKNELNKSAKIIIDSPKTDLNPTEVTDLMNLIVEKNIFESSGGNFIEAVSAKVITTQIEDLV